MQQIADWLEKLVSALPRRFLDLTGLAPGNAVYGHSY